MVDKNSAGNKVLCTGKALNVPMVGIIVIRKPICRTGKGYGIPMVDKNEAGR